MTASDARPPNEPRMAPALDDAGRERLQNAKPTSTFQARPEDAIIPARPPSDTGATGWHTHAGHDIAVEGACVEYGCDRGTSQRIDVLVINPAEARETIAAPIALARCQDVHANDTGNVCRACQSFAQVVALRILAALGGQEGGQP